LDLVRLDRRILADGGGFGGAGGDLAAHAAALGRLGGFDRFNRDRGGLDGVFGDHGHRRVGRAVGGHAFIGGASLDLDRVGQVVAVALTTPAASTTTTRAAAFAPFTFALGALCMMF